MIDRKGDELTIEIVDFGRAFNPLLHPVPDVSASIDKRLIGGLGIHLMRHMMDKLEYRRENDANCLCLTKHIGDKKND